MRLPKHSTKNGCFKSQTYDGMEWRPTVASSGTQTWAKVQQHLPMSIQLILCGRCCIHFPQSWKPWKRSQAHQDTLLLLWIHCTLWWYSHKWEIKNRSDVHTCTRRNLSRWQHLANHAKWPWIFWFLLYFQIFRYNFWHPGADVNRPFCIIFCFGQVNVRKVFVKVGFVFLLKTGVSHENNFSCGCSLQYQIKFLFMLATHHLANQIRLEKQYQQMPWHLPRSWHLPRHLPKSRHSLTGRKRLPFPFC